MAYLFWFFVLLPVFVYCADPEVTIKLGRVRGQTVTVSGKEVDQFLGIPFAKPPIGKLRFRRPVEFTEKWNGTLIAQTMSKSCVQTGMDPDGLSEDCLYINVWTPSSRSTSDVIPVMFWIYGGAFLSGSASQFNGAKLSINTNTVVVVFNYRVNYFGFVFGNSNEMPGNMGLYDQRLAMKWTKENIRQFGGDPNQTTIFGESAGSFSVSYHLMSKPSWCYFRDAILMSGVGINHIALDSKDLALNKSKKVAEFVGCKVDSNSNKLSMQTIACLRGKDKFELLNATVNVTTQFPSVLGGPNSPVISPVFGERFIPQLPQKLWKQKKFKPNTRLIVGSVFIEFPVKIVIGPNEPPSDAMRRFNTVIPKQYLTQKQLEQYRKIHFIGIDETSTGNEARVAAAELETNFLFQCPLNEFADRFSRIESNTVYQIVFNYKPKNLSEPFCEPEYPCHGSDLRFTFGDTTDPSDESASNNWMNIYGRFAYNGTAFWPNYYRTDENELVPVYYEFKGNHQLNYTQIGFRYFRCKIWSSMAMK